MRWPWSRRSRRPFLGPDSPIDWQVGDVAICRWSDNKPWADIFTGVPMAGPAPGSMSRVVGVVLVYARQYLQLREHPVGLYSAAHFDRLRGATEPLEVTIKKRSPVPERIDA